MSQFDCYQLQLVYPTVEHHAMRNLQQETLPTIFDIFNQSQHLLHTLHKSFFCISVAFLPFFLKKLINLATLSLDCGMRDPFSHQGSNLAPLHWQCGVLVTGPPGKSHILTFLEIIKHNVQKMLLFSFHLQYKLATQKVTSFDKFSF